VLTFSTAFSTDFPRYFDLFPSRSSTASNEPVDAPLGTAALPTYSCSTTTSTSTVGLPLESKICLATTSVIYK
jgi:hypothetical protein